MRLFLLLLFLFPAGISAQRVYKPVRSDIKAKNYKEALRKLDALKADTTKRLMDDPKAVVYTIEAYQGLYSEENVKLYLRQPYDTTAFFFATYAILREAGRLDSLDRAQAKRNDARTKYDTQTDALVKRYTPNLQAAATYYYLRRQYETAMAYLRLALELPHSPLGLRAELSENLDTLNAVRYTTAAYLLKRYDEVHRYSEIALNDSAARPTLIEWLAETARYQNNPAARFHWLKTGWREYPRRTKFFIWLADYYAEKGDYREVVNLAERQLSIDPETPSARLASAIARLSLKDFDGCIADGEELLRRDSTRTEVAYYVGAAYFAKAAEAAPTVTKGAAYKKAKAVQNDYCRRAAEALEIYRAAAPERQDRWAPMLYKIYLALNEGKKFGEIERLLQRKK